MRRPLQLGVVVLVVLGTLAVPASAALGAAPASEVPNDSDVDANGTVELSPGERLVGTIVVQRTVVEGLIEEAAFGRTVAAAEDDAERALVLAEWTDRIDRRIDELETRTDRLEADYRAGRIDEPTYRIRMARVATERRHLMGLASDSEVLLGSTSSEAATAAGLDPASVRALQDRTAAVGGLEASESARVIAADGSGWFESVTTRVVDRSRGEHAAETYLSGADDAVERAEAWYARAETAVETGDAPRRALAPARAALDDATTRLERARRAFANEDYRSTVRYARSARWHAHESTEYSQRAIDLVDDDDADGADAREAIVRADSRLDTAETTLDRARRSVRESGNERAMELLADARLELSRGETALENAKRAYESGRYHRAAVSAETASGQASAAIDHAGRAAEATDANDGAEAARRAVERAEDRLGETRERIDRVREQVDGDSEAARMLRRAESEFEEARRVVDGARQSVADGDYEQAVRQAGASIESSEEAIGYAGRASELAGEDDPRPREPAPERE